MELLQLVVWRTYDTYASIFEHKTIVVTVNVTEAGSGVMLSDKIMIPVRTQHYKMEFLSATPSSFKPGLTYVGFVSAK